MTQQKAKLVHEIIAFTLLRIFLNQTKKKIH